MNTDYVPLDDQDSGPPTPTGVFVEKLDREAGIITDRALDAVRPTPTPSVQDYDLPVPTSELTGGDDEIFTVRGAQYGFGTSRSEQHRGHPDTEFMAPGAGRCSACRWFEVRIIRVADPVDVGGTYVVHTYGGSAVPGERPRCRAFVTSSPYELVTFLTVRHNGHTYVPNASALAIAQSAHWDDDIRNACYNRETGLVTGLRNGDDRAA